MGRIVTEELSEVKMICEFKACMATGWLGGCIGVEEFESFLVVENE